MEHKILKENVNRLKMPAEMRERIIRNCYTVAEEKVMSKNTKKYFFKRPAIAVASLILCLCLTGVTTLAATGKLQGFFRDITGRNGAIIGTTYEQATEEVKLSVETASDVLMVTATMINPQMPPYGSFEQMGVESYRIIDMEGKVVLEGTEAAMEEVVDGRVTVTIPLENISQGEYKLVVSQLVGSSKADQPRVMSGVWECEFVCE